MGLFNFLFNFVAVAAATSQLQPNVRSGTTIHGSRANDARTAELPPWAQPARNVSSANCRCFPGDDCWPAASTWSAFNTTIRGRLLATVPLAGPCHEGAFGPYNSDKCRDLQAAWFTPDLHAGSPSSIMAPYFTNNSCNPFLPKADDCRVGSYVSYSVDVSEAEDVIRTIWFATHFNIRLVIKNTGHDYSGKSTGAGALGLWMHNLKDISFFDYKSANYTGTAAKFGAGVQSEEAFAAASSHGLAVVGAEVSTVGHTGGYTQGGGHSALASTYGLAADQVLEWEVVDGRGSLITASPSENSDLYWALCGGGGGTYSVVISMITKTYTDIPVTGANLTFTNAGVTQDQFFSVLETYQSLLADLVDAGATTVSFFTNETFSLSPLTAPGLSPEQVEQLLSPLLTQLKSHNISHSKRILGFIAFNQFLQDVHRLTIYICATLAFTSTQFPGYYEQFSAQSSPPAVGVGLYGGRFIPRPAVQENNTQLVAEYRYIVESGAYVAIVALNVSEAVTGTVWNSVNPAWRDTLIDLVIQSFVSLYQSSIILFND
ncbi:hypothetical protein diail_4195 [Diaporthe ilicicola]|nr:hypothetical protein diail_4195 [Diaporthe ilicicola]